MLPIQNLKMSFVYAFLSYAPFSLGLQTHLYVIKSVVTFLTWNLAGCCKTYVTTLSVIFRIFLLLEREQWIFKDEKSQKHPQKNQRFLEVCTSWTPKYRW